jgi:hypothetical protein
VVRPKSERIPLGLERAAIVSLFALGLIGALIGLLDAPPEGIHGGHSEQIFDLVRTLTTVALALSLLLGPGMAIRVLAERERPLGLAFIWMPGLGLMATAGGLAWALGGTYDPRAICAAVMLPVLVASAAIVLAFADGDVFDPEEQRTLLVVGCVLGIAIGRALWSLGPTGELYGGTVSRTLEVGDRSDSRISFILPQLIANHQGPYSGLGTDLFFPYNFSNRGPIPGMASTPVVMLTGGHPSPAYPEHPWAPFDREGFAAYRLAMMTFAATAFLSLWDLVRRIAGVNVARFAVLLGATTPFLVHEVWFTWPKMLAAAFVLAAAICVIERRPLFAGLLAGFGYMMHPIALLSLPALILLTLWPMRGARWNRPQVLRLVYFGVGLAVLALIWRVVNGSHFTQNMFLEYLTSDGLNLHPTIPQWAHYRINSFGNTIVPFLLWLGDSHSYSVNVPGGISPGIVHFFFQYWNTIPFGFGIVFFPMLLVGLWRAFRRWPWVVTATVLIPFVAFVIYWGSSTAGLMREGLQTWALTVIAVLACEQGATRFGWLRSTPARAVLTLRVLEVLLVAVLPTIGTRHELIASAYWPTDLVAVVVMFGLCGVLAALVWRARPPAAADEPPGAAGRLDGDD